jgi:hypothetical protein
MATNSRVTLRDCLWFAALSLVAIGWLLDHENLTRDTESRVERAKEAWSAATDKDLDKLRRQMEMLAESIEKRFPAQKIEPTE